MGGLHLAPPTSDQTRDLEAGGGFAAGFSVYLPAFGLTLVFLVMLLVGVRNPRSAAPLLVNLATLGFAAWVLSQGYLLDSMPSLVVYLQLSMALATIGAGVAAVNVFSARPEDRAQARSDARNIRS